MLRGSFQREPRGSLRRVPLPQLPTWQSRVRFSYRTGLRLTPLIAQGEPAFARDLAFARLGEASDSLRGDDEGGIEERESAFIKLRTQPGVLPTVIEPIRLPRAQETRRLHARSKDGDFERVCLLDS